MIPKYGNGKGFRIFPTIYQEYNKKQVQVDSKYLFFIEIIHS